MGPCIPCRKTKLNIDKPLKPLKAEQVPTLNVAKELKEPEVGSPRKGCFYNYMANTISQMKMTNPIKGLVSKRRKRYMQDGFNLDLTYIRDNLIAMGYPAEKLEGVYRNHIDDVVKFLEIKHKDHYKIYNLCSERSYDGSKFQQRVATYPFDDHNPPKMELIGPFCADVDEWLAKDCRNVAAVHCKAGKGRTGVMVCCYMLHSKQFPSTIALESASEALNYYGRMRTQDSKGVTIPSQRRYVGYYASLVQEQLQYHDVSLSIKEIVLEPVPTFNTTQGSLHVAISQGSNKIFVSPVYEVRRGSPSIRIRIEQNVHLIGDIKIEFYNKPKMMRKEKLFHFWFNTFFVSEEVLQVPDNPMNGNVNNGDMISPPERSVRAMSCDEQSQNMPPLNLRQPRWDENPFYIGPLKNKAVASSLVSLDDETKRLVLQLTKTELDSCHKDKQHKIYSADFRVSLFFKQNPCGSEPMEHGRMNGMILLQDTPSESSEADSSEEDTAEDEKDGVGWESVDSAERRVGRYRLLSDPDFMHSNQELYPS